MKRKTVVVCGRPNVGKSSLFNRLIGRKRALVLDTPGVTRDRLLENSTWIVGGQEQDVCLVDTGGLGHELFEKEIALQVAAAIEEADVVCFVVDYRAGLTPDDEIVLRKLRTEGVLKRVPLVVAINKVDRPEIDELPSDFFRLGVDHFVMVSAEHALGIDELKDILIDVCTDDSGDIIAKETPHIAPDLGDSTEDRGEDEVIVGGEPARTPRIAIVGQPNVGKSSLLNAILGEVRTIVSPIAGTTVDAVDTPLVRGDRSYVLVDTAGVRRKNKTEQGVEVLSVIQTKKALERADVALLVLDGSRGVNDQDEKIAGLIEEAGCSVILVLNKWDTQKLNDDFSQTQAEEQVREKVRFMSYAPLVFTTAIEGLGVDRLFRFIDQVIDARRVRVPTRELTDLVRRESEVHNPRNVKFYVSKQVGKHPPAFTAFVSDPDKIHYSLSRHLVHSIRGAYGFIGTPIRLKFAKAMNESERE